MRLELVGLGLCFVAAGVLRAAYPQRGRTYVRADEWARNPVRAKAHQRVYARVVGLFLAVGIGGALLAAGVFL